MRTERPYNGWVYKALAACAQSGPVFGLEGFSGMRTERPVIGLECFSSMRRVEPSYWF
jgi:hypothetical protein